MIWLRRLLFRRIVKGFEHRLKVLQTVMDDTQKEIAKVDRYIAEISDEATRLDTEVAQFSLNSLQSRKQTLSDRYWNVYARHEEVESGLIWITKDFNRR